jgi:hypothetical protein
MKALLKYGGLILILIGFIILMIVAFQGITGNTALLISGGLIFAGLLGYIVLNKYAY